MARKIYDVIPRGNDWVVTVKITEIFATKATAVEMAKRYAKNAYHGGELTQVRVRDKKGKIQTEWTYGKDPKRHKG